MLVLRRAGLALGHQLLDLDAQTAEPLVELDFAIDDDLESAVREQAEAAGRLGAQRNYDGLARQPHRLGHREDSFDFLKADCFQQNDNEACIFTSVRGCVSFGSGQAKRAAWEVHGPMFGTIKKIIKDKGFGFIIADDGGDEVFFHRSRLAPKVMFEDLREGNEVQFEVRPGEKGRQAFNLRLR